MTPTPPCDAKSIFVLVLVFVPSLIRSRVFRIVLYLPFLSLYLFLLFFFLKLWNFEILFRVRASHSHSLSLSPPVSVDHLQNRNRKRMRGREVWDGFVLRRCVAQLHAYAYASVGWGWERVRMGVSEEDCLYIPFYLSAYPPTLLACFSLCAKQDK